MKTYQLSYNNGSTSTHKCNCNSEAMTIAQKELNKKNEKEPSINKVDVWRMLEGIRFDYIVTIEIEKL